MSNSKLFYAMVIAGFLAFSSAAQAGAISNVSQEIMIFNSQVGGGFSGVGMSSTELVVAPLELAVAPPELGVPPSGSNGGPSEGGGAYCEVDCALPPVSVVPEPETYAMMLAGLGLLGFAARRRRDGISD